MSSSTTTTAATTSPGAGRPSISPLTILKSTTTSCKTLFRGLFASPRFTVCGTSSSEAEVNEAMKCLTKRLKRSEKEVKRSKSQMKRITKQKSTIAKQQRSISRLKGSRNQWRRIAEVQATQTFEVEYSATVTRLRRRLERAEVELDDVRNENQHFADQLRPLQAAQMALEEYRMVPILMEPLLLSPLEDTHACAIARQQALVESARVAVGGEGVRPVRAQSVIINSNTPKLCWMRPENPNKEPKRGVTG